MDFMSPKFSLTDVEYPAWCQDDEVPITMQEIREIFVELMDKFGFQKSSMENMYQHLMGQLDSRASRTGAQNALVSLHVSYIGGEHANYRKWYFAAQLDLDEEIGFQNMRLHGKARQRNVKMAKKRGVSIKEQTKQWNEKEQEFINNHPKITLTQEQLEDQTNLKSADYKWKLKMKKLTPVNMIRQLALYLLCWGEANQVRFAPECLCFIFKCALDYDISTSSSEKTVKSPEYSYLNDVITPLYEFLRGQVYKKDAKGNWKRREKDHKNIIGYDDINQLFWYPEGFERIILNNGERLVDKPLEERYLYFKDVAWSKVFYKTYRETRSWKHCFTNFNRFWIIHFAPFWFFTTFNSPTLYTKNYIQLLNNQPTPQVRLSVIAFGGTIACLVQILATVFEWGFVPREWPGAQHLSSRMIGLLFCLAINLGPSVYVLGFFEWDVHSKSAYIVSIVQLIIAFLTTFFFAVRPLGGLFRPYLNKDKKHRRYISSQTFTASFPKLTGRSKWFSYGLWVFVYLAKYIESYFFLTLSLRDPIRVLSIMDLSRCQGEYLLGPILCKWQAKITLVLMLLSDLGLFFLDTYLWYIICNCIFSIVLSFSLGTSILTPWKNVYSRLPKRIYSKILATSEMDVKFKAKILISQVWNAIVISMYREHLLSIEHLQRLLFQQVDSLMGDTRTLKSPTFFVAQDDSTFKSMEFFPSNSEAKRRISFFAQSLATPISEPVPVDCMPTFTVLVPHYSEKILLGLKEIIREESPKSKITVLEYLKHLHPTEWECFVKDTKLLSMEKSFLKEAESSHDEDRLEIPDALYDPRSSPLSDHTESRKLPTEDDLIKEKINDLPFSYFGFNSSEPSYTLRTRIWASLRTQTLYRTLSGFMNYSKAIKLLYRIENPSLVSLYRGNNEALENDLENMASRKFRMVVAMQRYAKFNKDEVEATELLLRAYPNMFISYLLEELEQNESEKTYYSCLTNGYAEFDEESGLRKPIFKIRLSGNPILGDGKSDNQNHSIIFYRGEYIQVIDANQDNYLEECLKIRSVLSEFEELELNPTIPYIPGIEYEEEPPPIAIVGSREYIFSENIGVLGDIAAGKEQTFGTLFARTLAEIGGKLHYGHPDFLNGIFMTTRGGLSKAQRGLHLNEDIYAGMNAICRGGKIKHSDYYQCGKGRDLGFGSILNFTTKIGAGMGEQLLSREYYYLGTQLPMDRFLSFFYAHPGFHLNNLFISFSVQLFFVLLLNLGALNHEIIACFYDKDAPITNLETPVGCYNIQPALHWVSIFVLSIFIVFFIAFAPLLIQEVLEKGIWRAASRFLHHLLSMAPLFEVFVCQVYSNSLLMDLTFGGAKYISTGRGFAITRLDFFTLYSRFVNISIYSGFQVFFMLLFAIISMWQPALLWFWITVISMCFAPFIFNPHQFAFMDFFIDYKTFIHWLFSGNTKYQKESWANFVKSSRSRFTGYKSKTVDDISEDSGHDSKKARFWNVFFAELFLPFCVFLFNFTAFSFINAQTGVSDSTPTSAVFRLLLVTFLPIFLNSIVHFLLFWVSLFVVPGLSYCCKDAGAVIAFIAHTFSVLVYLLDFELMWFLQGWNFTRTLILLITCINMHLILFKVFTTIFLTREYKNNKAHLAWWNGKWYNTGMGWSIILQPIREYFVKIMESSYFAADFFLGHFLLFIQTPIILLPFIDYWHTMVLFWMNPRSIIAHKRILTRKQRALRSRIVSKYFSLYFVMLGVLLFMLIAPFFAGDFVSSPQELLEGTLFEGIFQPNNQNNNDTGPNAPSTILTTTPTLPTFRTVA
ncbi:BAF_HP2_G0046410.mRNA.1.CDS.1 [Saccharomyces cerevisiae]|nr:BAF_HP2_G0046410.mRNA.1.CDS.1 [Saccharomyces cerevisiae]CAI6688230.1 BAF_HP2_G0046410.mRNA.1.CDS.1 [Saccharomyces cerevisiae]CAI6693827.1 BAF_HP1_G0043490.mRNA.1.CDS.1 [Saccharomyces cerevisiae]